MRFEFGEKDVESLLFCIYDVLERYDVMGEKLDARTKNECFVLLEKVQKYAPQIYSTRRSECGIDDIEMWLEEL